ncbi:MAG: hypothetical protein Q8889_01430 [Candidatus Phytoplasma australasiaticum]|nr:hypothetical protein [Candidatus Phytoplasma australasiaticum]MDV3199771.1 hypothetical protein [Candidatus Phytoplasma australasiaticum]
MKQQQESERQKINRLKQLDIKDNKDKISQIQDKINKIVNEIEKVKFKSLF